MILYVLRYTLHCFLPDIIENLKSKFANLPQYFLHICIYHVWSRVLSTLNGGQ